MATLTLVDDGAHWSALYLDGELLEQNRTCDRPERIANACIENDVDEFENRGIIDNGSYSRSKFPDSLEKIRNADDWELR
jgi:hypothetical protein